MMASLTSKRICALLVILGLLCLGTSQTLAQTTDTSQTVTDQTPPVVADQDSPEEGMAAGTNPPPFVVRLLEDTEFKPEQLDQMRTGGAGWGSIRIMVLLAERMAADSEGAKTFDEALAEILAARAAGKGFGQIAGENGLQVGETIRSRNRQRDDALQDGSSSEGDTEGDVEGDALEPETPAGTNPPPFIVKLLESTELGQEQLDQMRSGGAGWGNIRIMVLLAERMAADSEGAKTFEDALAEILAARAAGKGLGEIAGENGLQVGETIRNRNRQRDGSLQSGSGDGEGDGLQVRDRVRVREKKRGVFARLGGFLGFSKAEKTAAYERSLKTERPERPSKPEKFERPERAERSERPERPERPTKPEKPEKPERGPNR